jgi:hypothetical protein
LDSRSDGCQWENGTSVDEPNREQGHKKDIVNFVLNIPEKLGILKENIRGVVKKE